MTDHIIADAQDPITNEESSNGAAPTPIRMPASDEEDEPNIVRGID